MGRLCSLKRSLRRRLFSFSDILKITFSTLNHVNHIRRFTSNVRFDLIHLSSTIKSILLALCTSPSTHMLQLRHLQTTFSGTHELPRQSGL